MLNGTANGRRTNSSSFDFEIVQFIKLSLLKFIVSMCFIRKDIIHWAEIVYRPICILHNLSLFLHLFCD